MSLLDLQRRVTTDWALFNGNKSSPDSYVHIEGPVHLPPDCKVALDLSVGNSWFDSQRNAFWEIPAEGLSVPAKASVVIETAQKFTLPFNVFGFVTGKGRYIYQAVIISPGKIDPGFSGRLRIGVHNAGDRGILLKTGDPFCSVCFINLESTAEVPIHSEVQPPLRMVQVPFSVRLRTFWERHWDRIVLICFAALSSAAAVATFVANHYSKKLQ